MHAVAPSGISNHRPAVLPPVRTYARAPSAAPLPPSRPCPPGKLRAAAEEAREGEERRRARARYAAAAGAAASLSLSTVVIRHRFSLVSMAAAHPESESPPIDRSIRVRGVSE